LTAHHSSFAASFATDLWKGLRRWQKLFLLAGAAALWGYAACLPSPLFDKPFSPLLRGRGGELMGARVAADEQFRLPPPDSLPPKFERCIVAFEDKRFRQHWGIDPLALARAFWLNLRGGRVVSGGSTLTMQVIRLARDGQPRTYGEKLVEMVLASRLELALEKDEILRLYATHAPFGGNVVGLEAAAWRYFGRSPWQLSWAETAMLAVLPNSPALIHPGRNRDALRRKRDFLLDKLRAEGELDSTQCALAKEEPLPTEPKPFPDMAPHLLDRAMAQGHGPAIRSTLDPELQERVGEVLARHHQQLRQNQINNMAALVLDVETGQALAYWGNAPAADRGREGQQVDVVVAPRSTGSILKPFLYAAAQQQGLILPKSFLPDYPTQVGSYAPENYLRRYEGAVPADEALSRSLNVPAVRLLQRLGVEHFHALLQRLGLRHISKPASFYGLALILGGAEASLWDVCGAYASMARSLSHFAALNGRQSAADFREASYLMGQQAPPDAGQTQRHHLLGAGAIYLTFKALLEVERPGLENAWRAFSSSRPIAWKTGTSFGFRDAWAVGITPNRVVGVWVGNADGQGRPELVGAKAAAPILFDLFELLPRAERWFDPPYDDLERVATCATTGFLLSESCAEADTIWACRQAERSGVCPYHRVLHLDPERDLQVNDQCLAPHLMRHVPWLVLPPAMEWYYKQRDPSYRALPPFRPDCADASLSQGREIMEMIYPQQGAKLFLPIDFDGRRQPVVFRLAHRSPGNQVHWFLDQRSLGYTRGQHEMPILTEPGPHVLTLTDENGASLRHAFEVLR